MWMKGKQLAGNSVLEAIICEKARLLQHNLFMKTLVQVLTLVSLGLVEAGLKWHTQCG